MWKQISFPLVFSELFALVKHQFSDLILGLSLPQSILDSIAARFNNKAGKLNFDDFLQIICRIYSLKGMLNGSKNQFDNVDILCHNRSSHKCTNNKRGFVHTLREKSRHWVPLTTCVLFPCLTENFHDVSIDTFDKHEERSGKASFTLDEVSAIEGSFNWCFFFFFACL